MCRPGFARQYAAGVPEKHVYVVEVTDRAGGQSCSELSRLLERDTNAIPALERRVERGEATLCQLSCRIAQSRLSAEGQAWLAASLHVWEGLGGLRAESGDRPQLRQNRTTRYAACVIRAFGADTAGR